MTNRRRMKLLSLACVALLAGCGGGAEEQQSEQTSDELVVDLDSQGDFKAPGLRATLDAQGTAARTRVMVDGLDEGEPAGGGANPVHVHRGTCEEPIAAETYVIGKLKGPVAEAVIDVPISDLVGGGYVVEVHLLPAEGRAGPGEVIGCADLADAEPATGQPTHQGEQTRKEGVVAGAIDPTGARKDALDAFLETKLQGGFAIETHTDTHAIVVEKKSFRSRFREGGANRYVVSVDEYGEVTMIPAEPKRS